MISGQIISRTGRYKIFPLLGCGIAALAMYLLSTMGTRTSQGTVTLFMVVLGIGIGLTMQTLVLSVQNAVARTELGVATSSVSFFRSLGGSVGVALFGALFNSLLADRTGAAAPLGGETFTPDAVQQLPEAARTAFITGFADSLTTVFLWATPLILLAFLLTWFLREEPLRTSAEPLDHLAAGAPPGTHVPDEAAGHVRDQVRR
jgi:MFS family permease